MTAHMDRTGDQGELVNDAGFRVDDELAGLKPRPEDEGNDCIFAVVDEGAAATSGKIGMSNPYEAKQAAKRQRLERAAENASAESDRRFNAARSAVAGIPFGQPILVGHHSEGRHRAALRRHDGNMRAAIEADKRAEELARRAAAVGTGGISSDDPKAPAKLSQKVATLEAEREGMKAANKHYKKHGTLDGWDGPAELAQAGRSNLRVWGSVYSSPFPPYCLQNLGAEIRRASKRAANLTHRQVAATQEGPAVETINGVTITTDLEDNRVAVRFPARLSKPDYKEVRGYGFIWSPTRTAFVRKYTGPGIVDHARRMVQAITGEQGSG